MDKKMYRAPIIIMSFDRPAYLEQVLKSLVQQRDCMIEDRKIYFFQDGSKNPFSGVVRAPAEKVAANIGIFRKYVEHGKICASADNLGVALNFDRAERFAFEELDQEAAIFLEDDLVLSPDYINVLDHFIQFALDEPRISYVAAFGDHALSLHDQMQAPTRLIFLKHHWAFGLIRRHWKLNKPYIDQYLNLVRNVDYRFRDHERIFDLYDSWGMARVESSQDRAKGIACSLNNSARVNIRACFGRYIGAVGIHMYQELFDRENFDRTELFPEPLCEFPALSENMYQDLLKQQQAWATSK